jgi:hypothetical protein
MNRLVERSEIPEVRFDDMRATAIFPRPDPKHAVLVRMPRTQDGAEMPTFIKPEWGGVQVFYGDYYGIARNGVVVYGSAKLQWEAMHTLISPGYWVKTAVPMAYQANEPCRVVTIIPSDDGGVRETTYAFYELRPDDWVVRQPGGEVQHIKAANFGGIYFLPEEVEELGLDGMSIDEFASWAVAWVRERMSSPRPW